MHYLYELWHFVLLEWQTQDNIGGTTYLYILVWHWEFSVRRCMRFPPTCLLRISSVKRWTCTVSTSLSRPRRRRGWRESSMHSSTARSPNSGQREQNSGKGRGRRGPNSCKKLSNQGNSKSKRNVSHPSTTFFVWRPLLILNWECIGKGRQEKRGLYSSLNYWAIYFIISGSNWGGEEDSRQRERRNASKLWETQGTGEAATGENQKGIYDYCFKYKKIPNTLYVCMYVPDGPAATLDIYHIL